MTRSQSSRKPGFHSPVIAILTAAACLGTAQANGNLDAATLEALGVAKTSSATIAANSVGSRKASMAKLGLSLPEPALDSPAVARAEPKPEPEPAPQPVATPTRTPSEQVVQAPSEPQAPTPDPTPEPVVAEVTTPEVNEEPDPVLAQLPTEPTSAGYAEQEANDPRKAQPIEEETTASTPTAAEKPQSTGGGFFSKLFDFFFGWLV